MKVATILAKLGRVARLCLVAGFGLVAAGTAAASPRISDLDYLRASRCKAIAETLGGTDTASMESLLKDARRNRSAYIVERGEAEAQRARREARGERKDKVSAELASACTAYLTGDKDVAAR